jgi:hypothetical protein
MIVDEIQGEDKKKYKKLAKAHDIAFKVRGLLLMLIFKYRLRLIRNL